jgi:DNA-binding NtrC family response regulator
MRPRVLVVDDEPSIRKVLQVHLEREGYAVETVDDGASAIAHLAESPVDLVISDLKMPRVGGLELLAHVRQQLPGLPLVLITAHGTVDSAVEALKLGAHDYITKPFDLDAVREAVDKALRVERVRRKTLVDDAGKGRGPFVGHTPAIQKVYALVERVADSPATVLLVGESGTGKELVARALHERSPRRDKPFIVVNCGAIPEALFEAELFGYERGAFTGAVAAKPGKFELADGGTLFLDEVGELPAGVQVKLLRALQERQVERIGGVRPVAVDARVVAATNVQLDQAVAAGRFREDLYYRLNVVPIRLPALRERREDIPSLVAHFVERFAGRLGRGPVVVDDACMASLQARTWPGNIRELENVVERGVLLADNGRLAVDVDPTPAPAVEAPGDRVGLKDYVRVHTAKLERALIMKTLQEESGNVTRAARKLEISRKGLQLKMKEYGLREE